MHDTSTASRISNLTSPAPMRFLAVSGSLRRGSVNTALLRAATLVAPAGINVVLYDGIGHLPHFDPDCGDNLPPPVVALRALMCDADGLLIASPEYAHGVPGAFKNALDWVVSCAELGAKPVALLNASGRAVHAQAALAEVITTMNLVIIPAASLTIAVPGKQFDAGMIAAHPVMSVQLKQALSALAGAVTVHASR
jgi:chromate reductase